MTNKEIITALGFCSDDEAACDLCPYYPHSEHVMCCSTNMMRDALRLITCQQSQIEDLREALDDRIQRIKVLEAEVERLNSCVKTEDEVRAIMESSMQEVVKNLVAEQIEKAFEVGKLTGITELADKLIDKADIFCDAPNGASEELFAVPTESIKSIAKKMTESDDNGSK